MRKFNKTRFLEEAIKWFDFQQEATDLELWVRDLVVLLKYILSIHDFLVEV